MAKIKLHPVVIFLLGVLVGAVLVGLLYKVGVPGENIENTILRNVIFIPNGVGSGDNIFIPNGVEADTQDIFIPNGVEAGTQDIFIPNGMQH